MARFAENPSPHVHRAREFLLMLLVIYLALGAGFAVLTPPWQAPDEPAHYNYIAQIVNESCCPVIEAGDWDSEYLSRLTTERFSPDLTGNLSALEYEDHQPPLYYLLQAPVFTLSQGSLTVLRLVSVLIGAGVVLAAYNVALALLPDRPYVALGAAALVAFLPQHVAVLASVNNDGLAELVIGVTLLLTISYLKGGRTQAWHLGLLVGIGLITKISTIFLVGLVPIAIIYRWWINERGETGALVRALVLFALPVILLGGIWWARNLNTYDGIDVFGLGAHNAVVADQPRTADLIAQVGWGEYLRRGVETTYNSFWGQFGWMALPLPSWAYLLTVALLVVALSGVLLDVFVLRRERPATLPILRGAWFIMGLATLLAFAQFVYYNTEFLQFQGRYLYTALIPIAIWLSVGVDAWRQRLFRGAAWLPALVFVLLLPLDVYLLLRVIPQLAP